MARGNFFGYDAYIISDNSLKNITEGDAVVGFELTLRIANYRGYLLSQIEDVRIEVDGGIAADTIDDAAVLAELRSFQRDFRRLHCRHFDFIFPVGRNVDQQHRLHQRGRRPR